MDYVALGQQIRRIRRAKNLTQTSVANQVGLSAAYIGHIERATRIPSLETCLSLCKALDVDPNTLFGWTGAEEASLRAPSEKLLRYACKLAKRLP